MSETIVGGMPVFKIDKDGTIISVSGRPEDLKWIIERGFGEKQEDGKIVLSFIEALYLREIGKIMVIDDNGREYAFDELVKLFSDKSEICGGIMWYIETLGGGDT